jgi:hypothetical protein
MSTPDPQAVRRGRRQLVALAALFFVPLALAFWMYYGPTGWRPSGDASKGDLIDPARPLPELGLQLMDAGTTAPSFLRGKWTMLYVGDGLCDDACRRALYLTRQSRIALNKDMDRVQRVFLATSPGIDTRFIATEHPDLQLVLLGTDAGSQALLAAFPAVDGVAPAAAGRLYLIDPLGNLVLSYSAAAPDKALLTDVKKLLKLSHIG